jgi:hypothetical protein
MVVVLLLDVGARLRYRKFWAFPLPLLLLLVRAAINADVFNYG